MQPPSAAPSRETIGEWKRFALAYLAGPLREAAPLELQQGEVFPHSPLDGEGATAVFRFRIDRGRGPEEHFVAVGQTEPNYYPSYGLSDDEAFSLHIATRFMLVLGVAQVPPGAAAEHYDAAGDARAIVDRVAPGQSIHNLRIAATFDVEGQLHSVLRCEIGDRPVYIMGRDAPPGFYERVDLAPQVVFRLHLGNVLRREAAPKE